MTETYRKYEITAENKKDLENIGYASIAYVDYAMDGNKLVRTVKGYEDFSYERWYGVTDETELDVADERHSHWNNIKKWSVKRIIYVPTGKLNKGGHIMWESYDSIVSTSVKACGIIAKAMMNGRKYSLRQY